MASRAEILEELKLIGERPIIDAALPPLLFVAMAAAAGPIAGAVAAVAGGLAVLAVRVAGGKTLRSAAAGLTGTLIAASVPIVTGRQEAFFAPGILVGFLTGTVALLSVLFRSPMVAWTSRLVRRWPLAWYRHPLVRPAYRDVTLGWALFFLVRSGLQLTLAVRGEIALLAAARLLLGWPAILLLLVASYLYGTRRLKALAGPSVAEFRAGAGPPWTGQQRGF